MDLELLLPVVWLGSIAGLIGCLYVLRWSALVFEMLRPISPPKYCAGSPHRSWWLAPFVLFNPIPWLLLLGPPLLYRGLSSPHASFWDWFLFGNILGLSWFAYNAVKVIRRALLRQRQSAQP
jgi:hypothetical protein